MKKIISLLFYSLINCYAINFNLSRIFAHYYSINSYKLIRFMLTIQFLEHLPENFEKNDKTFFIKYFDNQI